MLLVTAVSQAMLLVASKTLFSQAFSMAIKQSVNILIFTYIILQFNFVVAMDTAKILLT